MIEEVPAQKCLLLLESFSTCIAHLSNSQSVHLYLYLYTVRVCVYADRHHELSLFKCSPQVMVVWCLIGAAITVLCAVCVCFSEVFVHVGYKKADVIIIKYTDTNTNMNTCTHISMHVFTTALLYHHLKWI